jgi:hypothetical protein
VPASAAKDASLAIRFGSQLRGADGSDAAFLEQSGRELGEDLEQFAVDLEHLMAESLGPAAEPLQDGGADIGTWPEPRRRSRQPLAAELAKTHTQRLGSGDDERAQLVEGGRARLDGASTLEQE